MGMIAIVVLMVGLSGAPLAVVWLVFHRCPPAWLRRRAAPVAFLPQAPADPVGRPIEVIAVNVRRLGRRYHDLHPHTAYAKVAAVRAAYDGALAECCGALGVAHLLAVLEPGPDLDAERERVEARLAASGFVFPDAA